MRAPIATTRRFMHGPACAFLLVAILALAGCPRGPGGGGGAYPPLELAGAWLLDGPRLLEPSGLAMVDGVLYTVCDKDDGTIYRIAFGPDTAQLVPHLRFTPPQSGVMDWEGITADPGGTFYLVSERLGRLLQVTADGTASWASPDLRPTARQVGLFQKINAGFEGVTWLGPNHWLGAVEREPRGLVEWRVRADGVHVTATVHEDSPFKDALPLLRLPDYAGLDHDDGRVFALFRNAHLVVRLERDGEGWREVEAWSYRHIETDPRWAYVSQTYGQAEGLVVRGAEVWIVFDNNLGPRQADRRDRRPLLVHARMPRAD